MDFINCILKHVSKARLSSVRHVLKMITSINQFKLKQIETKVLKSECEGENDYFTVSIKLQLKLKGFHVIY